MKNELPQNREGLRQRAQAGQQTIKTDLDPRFASALSDALAQFNSPSSAYLQRLKDEVKADIELVRGTSDEKDSPLIEKGTLNLEQADESFRPLIQMYLRLAETRPVEDLLALLQAYASLSMDYLYFSHVQYTNSTNQVSLPWEAYMRVYSDSQYVLSITRTFFPGFPDYSFGQIPMGKDNPAVEKQILQPFLNSFSNGQGNASSSVQARVTTILQGFGRISGALETYRAIFFPRYAADGVLRHFSISMYSTPGVAECQPLASGHAVLGGSGCYRPSLFRKFMDRYTSFYHRIADFGAVELLQGFISEYLRGEYGNLKTEPDAAWSILESKITKLGIGNAIPQLQQRWPVVTEILFKDDRLKKMLESQASGLEIFKFLKDTLLSQGVGVRQEMNRLVEAGFHTEFTPDVKAMEELQEAFQVNVMQPLMEKSIFKDNPKVTDRFEEKIAQIQKNYPGAKLSFSAKERLKEDSVLEMMEGKLTQFMAMDSWCPFFNDTSKTPGQKASESPWVINPTSMSTEKMPTSTNGANGIQQIVPYYKASFANAYTIQNSDRPEKMFAGIAVKTSLGLIIPNVVQARMLMADFLGEDKGSKPSDYGVENTDDEVRDSLMDVANQQYHFYDYPVLVQLSKQAFRDMIHRYGMRKLREQMDEQNITDSDEVAKRAALYEKNFSTNFPKIRDQFGQQFRQEMKGAAIVLRKWQKRIDELKENGYTTGSPSLMDDLLAGKASPQEIQQRKQGLGAGVENSLNKSFAEDIGILKRTADLSEQPEFKGKEDPVTLEKIYNLASKMPPSRRELTREEFTEQFRRYGKRMVPDTFYQDLMGFPYGEHTFQPSDLTRIYELASNNYHRRLEYMEYGRDLLLFRFPALKLNDAYLTYNGSESQYRKVMTAYLQNGVSEANRWWTLGATTWTDKGKEFFVPVGEDLRQARKIIAEVIPNVPLLDLILRMYPDQKAFVCSKQLQNQQSEDSYNKWKNYSRWGGGSVAFVGSLGMMMAVPFAPAAVAVGAGVVAVAAVTSTYQAMVRASEVDAARHWEIAASGQMGFSEESRNLDYIREMQKKSDRAYWVAAGDIALTAASALPLLPTLGRFAVTVGRGAWASGPLESMRYTVRVPLRLFTNISTATNRAAQPLVDAGILAEQTQPFLTRFWNAAFPFVTDAAGPLGLVERPAHLAAFGLIEYNNLLLGWAGLTLANTGRGMAAGFLFGATTLTPVGLYIFSSIQENATVAAMSRIRENPEYNSDLIQLMNGGYIRHSELRGIMETDAKLIETLKSSLAEEVERTKQFLEQNSENPKASADYAAALRQYAPKLDAALQAMEEKKEINTPDYIVLKRRQVEAKLLIRSLEDSK